MNVTQTGPRASPWLSLFSWSFSFFFKFYFSLTCKNVFIFLFSSHVCVLFYFSDEGKSFRVSSGMNPTSNKSHVMLLLAGDSTSMYVGNAQWTERSDTYVIPVSDGPVQRALWTPPACFLCLWMDRVQAPVTTFSNCSLSLSFVSFCAKYLRGTSNVHLCINL